MNSVWSALRRCGRAVANKRRRQLRRQHGQKIFGSAQRLCHGANDTAKACPAKACARRDRGWVPVLRKRTCVNKGPNENPPEPFPRAGVAGRRAVLSTPPCRRSRGRTGCTSSRCCSRSRSGRTGGRANGGRSAARRGRTWRRRESRRGSRHHGRHGRRALAHRQLDAIEAVASAATASAAVMSFLDFIISRLLGSERGAHCPRRCQAP